MGPAVEHLDQGIDPVGVRPRVVEGVGGGPADLGQVLQQPGFAPIERLGGFRRVAAGLDQGRDAQGRHCGLESLVRPGTGARHRPAA